NSYSNLVYIRKEIINLVQGFNIRITEYTSVEEDVGNHHIIFSTNNIAMRYKNVVMVNKFFDKKDNMKVASSLQEVYIKNKSNFFKNIYSDFYNNLYLLKKGTKERKEELINLLFSSFNFECGQESNILTENNSKEGILLRIILNKILNKEEVREGILSKNTVEEVFEILEKFYVESKN
ncbi:MAG: hypothetical protein ACRC2K_10365, partial [Clostridium sp.]